jgi:hypothetical protein
MDSDHVLVILADDAGHRALPARLPRHDGRFWVLLARPEDRGEERLDDHDRPAAAEPIAVTGFRP